MTASFPVLMKHHIYLVYRDSEALCVFFGTAKETFKKNFHTRTVLIFSAKGTPGEHPRSREAI